MRVVAFIPARSGSKRLRDKNIKSLLGHPLIAYSISVACNSGIFDRVICATDSEYYADIAKYYGAETPYLRASAISDDKSPDIEWVTWLLDKLADDGQKFEAFSILRPTSPFRTSETITAAWDLLRNNPDMHSIRAVQKCSEHPGKMWKIFNNIMYPIMPFDNNGTPWHSSQYAALPDIYVQNASLEIAWTKTVTDFKSIAGNQIMPLLSKGLEGFDINNLNDWFLAEKYINTGEAILPLVEQMPY